MNAPRLPRRTLLAFGAGAFIAPAVARAQTASSTTPAVSAPFEVRPLWPGAAPGGEAVTVQEQVVLRNPNGDPNDTAFVHVRDPWIMLRRPSRPNGAAILMIPGGGYQRVAVSKAGGDIDARLAEMGYTVFVMDYRLPADGWAAGPAVALQDAQRAIRIVRSRAAELGFDPNRVAVAGFSAGGHVAGLLATRFAQDAYAPVDAIDGLPTRPDFAGLIFPVVTLTQPYAHGPSARALVGSDPTDAARDAWSIERHVPADMPPTFIASAADDRVVPVENSLMLWQALRAQNLASELHVFEKGGHGLTDPGQLGPSAWESLFDAFVQRVRST
ncbi:alpha/beta hydrolase [Brevundimonas sp. SPF441]|uniref:alpha/beta hydrolase n=1 Tax=Brevundimonas sp. SPF441 TaxID=2663795 RepID=UPI00129E01B6|nr:alpha/beta hydrolase [Brevundimonas sp. SPF441]MRL68753.1 alpha/beta hydrolase fold domain-containing protein [Brevundimonas sp. SPF441]